MANVVYEGLFLLDSNRYGRNPSGVSDQIVDTITKLGGEILVSRLWNEQRLAYPVNGQRKGTYWLTYFRLDSLKQPDLNRQFQLNDNVLRNLILKVDERLIDALVQHASGEKPADEPATGPGEEKEKKTEKVGAE